MATRDSGFDDHPLSLVGSIWLLYALDYNLSVAVWVGLIALAGLEVETGLIVLLYLESSVEKRLKDGRLHHVQDLWAAIHEGAMQRLRPKTMTEVTTFIALVPLLFAEGAGADTMRRLAAPMIGGVISGYFAVMFVLPVMFYVAKRITLRHAWQSLEKVAV